MTATVFSSQTASSDSIVGERVSICEKKNVLVACLPTDIVSCNWRTSMSTGTGMRPCERIICDNTKQGVDFVLLKSTSLLLERQGL